MKKNILIIGAGASGRIIGSDIMRIFNYHLVGYLDDDPKKEGLLLNDRLIFGSTSLLPSFIDDYNINYVIISIPSAKGNRIYSILNKLIHSNVEIKIVPGYYHLLEKDIKINYPIRNVDIIDFLKKPKITLDINKIVAALGSKKVLITGAGGSIGRELAFFIASVNPKEIILLGRGENSIFHTFNDLRMNYPKLKLSCSITNIANYSSLEYAFKKYSPEVIFHAAAHKHVHFMEEHIKEAFNNNVIGSLNLMSLSSRDNRVERFVLISTDKAVLPTSVMGATKRITELLMLSYADISETIFCAVRFGNVLGSRGSVLPLFKKQIEMGGPVTVTDKEVSRYFMTIAEAAQLVIQSCALSSGKEIFILNMGECINIYELAKLLIQIYNPNLLKDVDIVFTGLREGEKLKEELWTYSEAKKLSVDKDIYKLDLSAPSNKFFCILSSIVEHINTIDERKLKEQIFELTKS